MSKYGASRQRLLTALHTCFLLELPLGRTHCPTVLLAAAGATPVMYNVYLFLSSLALLAMAAHGAMASEVGCTPLPELACDHFLPSTLFCGSSESQALK